ncbi:hypothetical protein IQ235_11330 [Oscillatoriales cyanobacterium LEGE 11467]|uniref:Uncharacterized protein n=1 Tax=Zarconia navalis LEGE 11467 TaxID=1828826 RepID=A0A928VY08_9CYAN|nr:hypothetical protein [Zarconia navalis]MBE9041373.1 hypothetical protein [Zarconia navalis LEGE 11467]
MAEVINAIASPNQDHNQRVRVAPSEELDSGLDTVEVVALGDAECFAVTGNSFGETVLEERRWY